MKKQARELIDKILKGKIKNKRQVDSFKRELSRKYGTEGLARSSDILKYAKKEELDKLGSLIKKPVRTISGVAIVAVMHNEPCPNSCIYCPQGDNAPKSYTGKEPAARRAAMFNFDPYLQTKNRLEQLKAIGHSIDKVDLIVMGATFPACEKSYQEFFAKRCFDALNDKTSKTLEDAQKVNETAGSRCTSLCIETRPDYCKKENINEMLKLGATRVELGVQTLSDEVYEKVERGHSLDDVIKATKLLKDSGLKACFQMMPGLFQTPKQDLEMFKELFKNPDFRPDMIKIYPTLVIKGTGLYDLWKNRKYKPLSTIQAVELIAKIYSIIPKYVRVMRIQRDIGANLIEAGVKASNLRELIEKRIKKSKEIRYREAGHRYYKEGLVPKNIELVVEKYKASGGTEYFISLEDLEQDILVGYARLRIPSRPFRKEIFNKAGLIRELKVVGTSVPLNTRLIKAFQHKGFGKQLMKKAEEIAKKEGMNKISVMSAVGTRKYYEMLGYKNDGVYVSKTL